MNKTIEKIKEKAEGYSVRKRRSMLTHEQEKDMEAMERMENKNHHGSHRFGPFYCPYADGNKI